MGWRSCSYCDGEISSESSPTMVGVGMNLANLSSAEKAKLAKFDGEVRKAIGALIEAKEETRSLRNNILLKMTIAQLREENEALKESVVKMELPLANSLNEQCDNFPTSPQPPGCFFP